MIDSFQFPTLSLYVSLNSRMCALSTNPNYKLSLSLSLSLSSLSLSLSLSLSRSTQWMVGDVAIWCAACIYQ